MPKAVPAAQRRTVVGRRRKTARRDGLEKLDVRPHSFRHACGYYLAERGADLRLIQAYLGHRQVRHTTRYVRLSPRRFEGPWDD